MRTMRRLWESISEPRRLNVAYFYAYAVALYTGLVTLVFPPNSVEGVLGQVVSATWSILFIASGIGGMSTCLIGWWKWERWSVVFGLSGVGIYAAVVIWLQVMSLGGFRFTQLGIIALASFVFTIRLLLIRGFTFDPRR